jgi:cytochrome c5
MKRIAAILCILISITLYALAVPASRANGSQSTPGEDNSSQGNSASPDGGEKVFAANCARCHMPPMSITQRVTGTVVMHMRVRARLSQKDEQLLLKYLAP